MSKLDTEKILHNQDFLGNKILNAKTETETIGTANTKGVANVDFVNKSLESENEIFTQNIIIGTNTITHSLASVYIHAYYTIFDTRQGNITTPLPITIIDETTIAFESSIELIGVKISLHKNSFKQ